jgi:hypothetical protein
MPHHQTRHRNRSRRHPADKRAAPHNAYDIPRSVDDVVETALIPAFRPMKVNSYVFRYLKTAGDTVLPTQSWTTTMLLDDFAMSLGSGTARRIFNAIKLKRVEIWAPPPGELGLEFAPAAVAGTAGSFRVPVISNQITPAGGTQKNQHICARPTRDDLAGKVFTSQQPVYVLWNASIPNQAIMEIEYDAVFWNADGSPYATAYSSSAAAGTIGLGNFSGSGMTGWRVIGWSNLATP